jgi:hypothetical protein
MATQTPPKRGTAYTTYVWLTSQSNPLLFQTSVTLAAGDVTVSKDGGAFANIATLPTEIGTTGCLEVALSAAEMTADTVAIRFRDVAGDEWCDLSIVEHTAEVEIDDLPTATEIADAVLKRGVDNTEATADVASLTELILAAFESKIAATTWTIYKTNHSDTFNTRTVSLDASADPITEVT